MAVVLVWLVVSMRAQVGRLLIASAEPSQADPTTPGEPATVLMDR